MRFTHGSRLLAALGCTVEVVHEERDSEPSPENLVALARAVHLTRCHLGMAQDLDADRLALVSEAALPIGEDYTLALAVRNLLESSRGQQPAVVKNLSTTRVVDDLVESFGGTVIETPVGEINLSRALAEQVRNGRTAFGGEGNGGVIVPAVLLGRDSLVGAALTLDLMARHGKSLSALVAELPPYHLVKAKVPLLDPDNMAFYLDQLAARFPKAEISRQDGLRLRFPDRSWFAVRPSNTEPVLRVVAESPDPDWAANTVRAIEAECRGAG